MKKPPLSPFSTIANCCRRLATVGLAIFFLWTTAIPSVQAGNNLISVPLRWCVIGEDANNDGTFDPGERGVPAFTNPGGVGEPDTDNVLWRRHERASDNIWIPGANITFRSGITAAIRDQATFPIIADPSPPENGGVGQYGDILDPQINGQELNQAITACNTAWNNLAMQFNTTLVGPIALNLRQFVNNAGNPTNLIGWGGFTGLNGGANTCATPPTNVTSAIGGSASVVDNSFRLAIDPIDALLAHELGHVLRLGHGNGLDDDNDDVYDDNIFNCDPNENVNAPPPNMMAPTVGSGVITTLQRQTSRPVALVYSGSQIDPPAALINGDTLSDQRVDEVQEVTDESVDLAWISMIENEPTQTTIFSHRVFGLIDQSTDVRQYLIFADLDDNPGTGGNPADLGFATSFQGAELVTRVEVSGIVIPITSTPQSISATPPLAATGTVWRFENGDFVKSEGPNIRANAIAPIGGETPLPLFHLVSIEMPNSVRGSAEPQVRLQAIAQRLTPQGQFDRLPSEPRDGGVDIRLIPPQFPTCSVRPPSVSAGRIATIEASDLIENETAKVFLGDQLLGTVPIDEAGNVKADFIIPNNANRGPRLVTVGVMGTALTADCSVDLTRPQLSRYEYTPKLVCGLQKEAKNMQLARGFYGTTINIHNPGLSTVQFDKKLVLTIPPGNQQSGRVLPIGRDELESQQGLAVDCDHIRKKLFDGKWPNFFIEGFVTIESPESLDVTSVYTTANLGYWGKAKNHSSIDVEQIRERINK
ncbi:unknown [Crocosphaera subtropica ATCC 51142]|uniref:Uncharacterized protein n=1 Tax=Crocosphaera subtropica (strain ATCC 51142 / BH68) TaxID=43989 RepID=B1WWR8_CROS5|nr:hypothetical protein [Crocosphaera subtropica]ACB50792.1 unknown [Crocosphaera subtropica ATCC 51142]